MFVKIKEDWPTMRTITSTVHSVFHGTHFDKIVNICTEEYAFLKPHKKKWRVLDCRDYNKEYCSYIISPGQTPEPFTSKGDHIFGPVVWFSTREHETDRYGPCQLEFNFKSVLEAYQRNRGRTHKICYRAAGTMVYDKEISHVVLICSMADREHETLPLITGGNTIYFRPSVKDTANSSSELHEAEFHVTTNEYCIRHEHVVFAIYQPRYQKLCMSIKDGLLKLTPHKYCVPSKKKKCKFARKQTLTVDKLYTYAAWLTSEAKSLTLNFNCYKFNKSHDSFEQPMITSSMGATNEHDTSLTTTKLVKLDKSLEASFNWLGDMNNKECSDLVETYSEDHYQRNNNGTELPDKVTSQLDKNIDDHYDWLSDISDTECHMT